MPEAVKLCKDAGINVRLISGDKADNCRVIAKEAGIEVDPGMADIDAHEHCMKFKD